jgi:ASC-1-like (ASCH) protein
MHCGRGPEMPDLRFSRYPGFTDVFKPNAVENVLPGRKTLEQHFRSKVVIRQRIR